MTRITISEENMTRIYQESVKRGGGELDYQDFLNMLEFEDSYAEKAVRSIKVFDGESKGTIIELVEQIDDLEEEIAD